jgi:hypothetical protein
MLWLGFPKNIRNDDGIVRVRKHAASGKNFVSHDAVDTVGKYEQPFMR